MENKKYEYYYDVNTCAFEREKFLADLNKMGDDGWELISVTSDTGFGCFTAWFKRIKQ